MLLWICLAVLIFGIYGTCRRSEFLNSTVDDIKYENNFWNRFYLRITRGFENGAWRLWGAKWRQRGRGAPNVVTWESGVQNITKNRKNGEGNKMKLLPEIQGCALVWNKSNQQYFYWYTLYIILFFRSLLSGLSPNFRLLWSIGSSSRFLATLLKHLSYI